MLVNQVSNCSLVLLMQQGNNYIHLLEPQKLKQFSRNFVCVCESMCMHDCVCTVACVITQQLWQTTL